MNILWITNIIFPAPSEALGLSSPVVGGWMYSLAMQVVRYKEIRLCIATVYHGEELKSLNKEGIQYFLLPSKFNTKYQKRLEPYWYKICQEFKPDKVHIHGTEYPHGLACMRVCPSLNYLVSIQGMVGVYSRYYYANISNFDIIKNITFRDIVRFDTLFQGKRNFEKRGKFENECLQKAHNVVGRTNWDYVHVKAINPKVNYHFCNESLRDAFYTSGKWDIKKKTDYSIFVSQASVPFKGFHQILKAVAQLKAEFPKIKIRIAGPKIIMHKSILDKIKLTGYGSYIRNLIMKLNLNGHVQFIGTLTEEHMVAEYKNAHLFICSSSIENSPNSLGEAQILGVPVVASYVGGIPDMVTQEDTGLLYRFEEVEMLAYNIKRVLEDDSLALRLSKGGIVAGSERHDRVKNTETMISIYKKLVDIN